MDHDGVDERALKSSIAESSGGSSLLQQPTAATTLPTPVISDGAIAPSAESITPDTLTAEAAAAAVATTASAGVVKPASIKFSLGGSSSYDDSSSASLLDTSSSTAVGGKEPVTATRSDPLAMHTSASTASTVSQVSGAKSASDVSEQVSRVVAASHALTPTLSAANGNVTGKSVNFGQQLHHHNHAHSPSSPSSSSSNSSSPDHTSYSDDLVKCMSHSSLNQIVAARRLTRKLSEQRSSDFATPVLASPDDFVHRYNGNRVVKAVLIANNGIAAVKCMRSIRRWSYEVFRNERAIKFVIMYTPEDLKANAEYIRIADHCVPVPGGSNNNNYANCDLILDIAKRIPVQAVWAGWGHASENPKLPELLNRHGIAFIGPPEQAMWALGDKIASSIVAQTAGVPTLPWSGSGLTVSWSDTDRLSGRFCTVDELVYEQACVNDAEEGVRRSRHIGYPLMVKASEGGGGKGIRKVNAEEEFVNAYRQVQAEVPGSPIFIMKYAPNARHIEVQILADNYGNAISLFGRDCSIQRRHQKIIEEAPATIADQDILESMERDAVRLAKMVGYVSAGTVEYLYNPDTYTYCFLELNPRLQVEHPCTEMITDVNLPACQLQIAMGISLHRIKDIRALFGECNSHDTLIDFDHAAKR